MTTGKTIALTTLTFVGKVMSLLFNMLSRLVIMQWAPKLSYPLKKTGGQRIDAFEVWCWRRFLSVPWTARRSNQSILKEISPAYSLEGLILKLQHFCHLMQRTDSFGKDSDAGRDWGQEEKGTTEDEMAGWHH